MATREQCESYDQCGYVNWRTHQTNGQVNQLPEDGDCGKADWQECGRVNGHFPVNHYGPITREEMEIRFPLIPNDNRHPPKRIHGGGNR